MSLQSGDRLGQYEIAAPIGAGGMGEVYRATDMGLFSAVTELGIPKSVGARVSPPAFHVDGTVS